jgi:hypothetical protein
MEITQLNGIWINPLTAVIGTTAWSNGVSTHLEPIVTATQLDRLFALTALSPSQLEGLIAYMIG